MAIVWGGIVNGYGRIGIEVTTSDTNTVRNVTAKIYVFSKYGIYDVNNTFYFDWGKTEAVNSKGSVNIDTSHNSGSGWNEANKQLIATYTGAYNRTTSDQMGYAAAKLTGIDTMGSANVMTVYTSFSVPAKTSYSVKYDANGGTGAPSNQTKWYGTNLTLSNDVPTRTGYTFNGWNTKSDGSGTNYNPGATYSSNAALTLYAKWTVNTYLVKYDANGGTGAPGDQNKIYGTDLVLSNTIPTKDNYNFKGWATSADGTPVYQAGEKYTVNSPVTLYAIWELAYYKPEILNFKVIRCDSNGVLNDFATSCKIEFDYNICQLLGDNHAVSLIYSVNDASGEVSYSNGNLSVENMVAGEGHYSFVIPYSNINIDSIYHIELKLTDSQNENTSKTAILSASKFPFDMKDCPNGGVAIGGPATLEGVFQVLYPAMFTNGFIQIVLDNDIDLNTISAPNIYTILGTYSNCPVTNGRLTVFEIGNNTIGQNIESKNENNIVTYSRIGAVSNSTISWGEWKIRGQEYQQKITLHGDNLIGCIRIPDIKVQIAWVLTEWTGVVNTAWGNVYECGKIQLNNWYLPFSKVPRVINQAAAGGNAAAMTQAGSLGNATVNHPGSISIIRGTPASTSYKFYIHSIGIGFYA